MTVRPRDPGSRRRPLHAAVALVFVMVAVLLAAGCFYMAGMSDNKRDEDIVAIKLNSDGSTAWMKTIDSGKSDTTKKILQTRDGGYTIAGHYSKPVCNNFRTGGTPIVIHLSDTGEILWRKDYDLGSGGMPPYSSDQIAGIVESPESGYYLISSYGGVVMLDSQGSQVWRKNLSGGEPDIVYITYASQNPEGSIVIGGSVGNCSINPKTSYCTPHTTHVEPFISKLDRDGNQVWFTRIPYTNFLKVVSLKKMTGNRGYIGHISSDSGIPPLFKVDETGQIINSDPLHSIRNVLQIESSPEGFSVFSVNQSIQGNSMNRTFIESSYTYEGNIIKTTNLLNITQREAPSDRDMTIVTSNENLFSINLIALISDYRPRGVNVHAQEVTHEDELIWDRNVTSYKIDPDLAHIRDVIKTKDNGFMVVLGVEKRTAC
jgi:hypothetical protein